ncbi:hypothetical protein DLJ53_30315 [Acuticoccus sediminis]|uniref:Uncharacterized protein n=2 Tax=Acuticoccus sediminis TaxID=2184697 RepID=A0A8B2NN32_9HYPH|nr:hypothetical protein DLJ53_30315 [Acuticoccus sediminis]
MAALLAATMGAGIAATPAAAQVTVQFGDTDNYSVHDRNADRREHRLDHREDKVEAEGDRRADYAASKGNYKRAAKIEERYDRKLDKIDDQQARVRDYDRRHDDDGVTIQLN